MTFAATVNPVVYEGGIPVFIDTERDTWNMDPVVLEKAFEIYPEVKLVVVAHLYGTPGKVDEIQQVCEKHGALSWKMRLSPWERLTKENRQEHLVNIIASALMAIRSSPDLLEECC